MAVVHNLKPSEWYYDSTSVWTVDYPPFFAYFEKFLATIALLFGLDDILVLKKAPLFNKRVLYFQRISVIATDAFYIISCIIFCFCNSSRWNHLPRKLEMKARIAAFIVLSCNVDLILIDNIHFQYNSMLTAMLIFSVYLADSEKHLASALLYCILVNFKHIYLYYAPAYVVFFLRRYFVRSSTNLLTSLLKSTLKLAVSIIAPFVLSFGPLLVWGGCQNVLQILSRLFPISRGLTHAYWAPNFWALYNIADLSLYHLLSLWKPEFFMKPEYCSGIVKVYSHSVLPTITPLLSMLFVLASLVVLFLVLFKRKLPDLCTLLSLSAFSFFWYAFIINVDSLLSLPDICYICGLTMFEFYATFIHKAFFNDKFAFLPLMMISAYNALGVMRCYIWLIILIYSDDVMIIYKKKCCELVETSIREGYYPVQAVDSFEEIELIGGIDISYSTRNQDFAVVAFNIFDYSKPYISDYLAIREAAPLAEFVNKTLADYPLIRPDVIICDGNGQFHIRRCGVACHIGALTGIATIGVAKNLNVSLFKLIEGIVERVSAERSDGYAPMEMICPVLMNITRLGGSKVPVYVSAGYGIELDLATKVVISTAQSRTCEPIRVKFNLEILIVGNLPLSIDCLTIRNTFYTTLELKFV
ncbi:deoxyribonuclease V [Dictyocaulus viviparus]|uniref:Alpha-1,3-glucosyltransferase n=1 Tax=Dictyocaulus viviparus TaxID=29172 RepID=A0A0D8XUT5_DICVI|nr:deoxyribonuclease V [Dictyocaulus viviparus]